MFNDFLIWRRITSLAIALFLIVLLVSGIVLCLDPSERVARTIGWTVFGLTKDGWITVHVVAGFTFVTLSLLHICYNWHTMKGYVVHSRPPPRRWRLREGLVALALVGLVAAGTISGIPPFSYVARLVHPTGSSFQWTGDGNGRLTTGETGHLEGGRGNGGGNGGGGWRNR